MSTQGVKTVTVGYITFHFSRSLLQRTVKIIYKNAETKELSGEICCLSISCCFPIDLVPFRARAYCTLKQFSARVSSFILRSVVTDMNSKLMLLPRESLFQLAIRHFKKRGGNWAELIFPKTSGIVTSDVSVIYWPIFVPVPSNSPRSLCDRKS